MALHGDATVTFDTVSISTDYEWKYPAKDGMTTYVVSDAETIVFDLTAAATGTNYRMVGGDSVSCAQKSASTVHGSNSTATLTIEKDPAFTWFHVPTDDTAAISAGAMRIKEPDGNVTDWEISSIVIDNVDQPTAIKSATFSAKDGSMRQFFWGSTATSHPGNTSTDSITVAQ